MKKGLFILGGILLALSSLLISCDGSLHNTAASFVKLEVVNFPVDGDMSFTGAFAEDGWNNSSRKFTVTDGAGKYDTPSLLLSSDFKFSITSSGSWDRPWFPAVKANSDDFGKLQNIEVKIPMDGNTYTIVLDGSKAVWDKDTIVIK